MPKHSNNNGIPAKAQEALEVFRAYCAKRKMRYTPEREIIIRAIYDTDGNFDIERLFARVRTHPKYRIAKTSIYRSVPYLLDAGLLRESIAQAGHVVYERTLGRLQHDHFKCIKCGKLVEFYSPALEQAQKKVCRQEKFKVLWRTNVINGYCQDCAE